MVYHYNILHITKQKLPKLLHGFPGCLPHASALVGNPALTACVSNIVTPMADSSAPTSWCRDRKRCRPTIVLVGG